MAQGIPNYRQYYSKIEPLMERQDVQTYSGLILFLLTTSFFIFFAIKPTINTIATLNKQITDARDVDNKLQNKINALSMAQNEYNKVKDDMPYILGALPGDPRVMKYAQLIEGVSRASGVKVESFQIEPIDLYDKPSTDSALAVETGLEEHGFNLFVSGEYKNLTSFEEYIRKIQRLTVLDSITINKSNSQSNDSSLGKVLSGKVYILK